jgi:hypothetical protein
MALFAFPSRDLLFTNTHKRRLEKQGFLFFKEKKTGGGRRLAHGSGF